MHGFTGDVAHPLSFVRLLSNGTKDFWSPRRTGDYEVDCRIGRAAADETLTYIRDTQDTVIFGAIVRAITRHGRYDGVEAGFCTQIGIDVWVNR